MNISAKTQQSLAQQLLLEGCADRSTLRSIKAPTCAFRLNFLGERQQLFSSFNLLSGKPAGLLRLPYRVIRSF